MFKKFFQDFNKLFIKLLDNWRLKLSDSQEQNSQYQLAYLNVSRLQAVSLFLLAGTLIIFFAQALNSQGELPMWYFYVCLGIIAVISLVTFLFVRFVVPKKTFSIMALKGIYWSFWSISALVIIFLYMLDAYSTSSVASLFAFYLILAAIPVFSFWEIFIFLMLPNTLMVSIWYFGILTFKETIYTIFLYEAFALTISQSMYHTFRRMIDYEIKLKQSTNKLELMSLQDPLTGLLNRFGLNKAFQELKNNASIDEKLFIIAMDIDFFKNYNDKHGHLIGDECLVQLANNITTIFNDDRCATGRIGGDEFIIFYKAKYQKEVEWKMQAMYASLSELSFNKEAVKTKITLSSGIAYDNFSQLTTWTDLYFDADVVLYQIKNSGRNQFLFVSKNR
ncbi:MAG: diguanylate cyclase [Bacilli bacterium]